MTARCLALLLLGLPALALPARAADNLVRNASFERVDRSGAPAFWTWQPGAAKGSAAVDDAVARSGSRSLRIANPTAKEPHVFSSMRQSLAVAPGETYTLSAYVRGAAPGTAWIGGGPQWKVRVPIPAGDDWQRVSATFTPSADVHEWELLILTESPTEGFWIDDVQVERGEQATAFELDALPAPGELRVRLEPARGGNLLPNASFEHVDEGEVVGWTWDAGATDATLETVTPGHYGARAVRLTNGTPLSPHVYGRLFVGQVEVQPSSSYTLSCYVRTTGKVGRAWVGGGTQWRTRLAVPDTHGEWRRIVGTFETNADDRSIPIMILSESPTDAIEFDDIQLEPGDVASPFGAPDTPLPPQVSLGVNGLVTSPAGHWKPDVYHAGEWAFVDEELEVVAGLRLDGPRPGARAVATLRAGGAELASAAAQADDGLPVQANLRLRYGLPADLPEQLEIDVRMIAADGEPLAAEATVVKVVTPSDVRARLDAVEGRLGELAPKAEASDEALVTLTTIRHFIGWSRDDLDHGVIGRAYDTALELEGMLAAALAAPVRPRAPRYVTSPLTIAGPAFLGTAQMPDGERVQRPVYFTGYGHFGSVRRMVEEFPKLGNNLIQIEFGPRSVLPNENDYSDAAIADFLAVCDRAAAADVQVNLLLSPHYFPGWALAKWPHLADYDGGFLPFCIHAPEARAVIEKSLRYVIPRIKDHPALHSLCLSNEPICVDQSKCETATALWREWLAERIGDIAAINARWGTDFASLDAVPIPPAKFEASAMVYDYTIFNQESFAGWHQWMADIIHELAPDVPVHAKIMIMAHFNRSLHGCWSVAPELFGALSQINGNDCTKWPHSSPPWACSWVGENMGYDYQRSAADLPIFNSENHIIVDRDLRDVQPEFIRNVYWQGAIHGQGATTTWVWERTYDPNSGFAGSIMHRPECAQELGHTTLDLNRAAPEVAAIAAQPAPLAVLWSQASTVWQGDEHARHTRDVYTAANFLDLPVGFVNERDCAAYAAGETPRAFDSAQVILVPAASHVPDAVVAALQRFVAGGGRVIRFGECFTHDEAGRARAATAVGESWPLPRPDQPGDVEDLWLRLREALAGDPAPAFAMGYWGVETRAAEVDGGVVANLCNYLDEPVTVALPPGCVSVLTGEDLAESVQLQPMVPLLLRR